MKVTTPSFERFPALSALGCVIHGFTLRVPGIAMSHDKAEALLRLDGVHRGVLQENGLTATHLVTAKQVHGKRVETVRNITGDRCFADADGLITNEKGICLGIYVADCCAAFIVDPVRRAIGLVHSGKKGTELGIVPQAIESMVTAFGSEPGDLVVQLSPCIRPPHYEIDFAADIRQQCKELGVKEVNDSGVCTACDLDRYYSYRAEKGKTGRMLAFLSL